MPTDSISAFTFACPFIRETNGRLFEQIGGDVECAAALAVAVETERAGLDLNGARVAEVVHLKYAFENRQGSGVIERQFLQRRGAILAPRSRWESAERKSCLT